LDFIEQCAKGAAWEADLEQLVENWYARSAGADEDLHE
jgi:hypothetical protein